MLFYRTFAALNISCQLLQWFELMAIYLNTGWLSIIGLNTIELNTIELNTIELNTLAHCSRHLQMHIRKQASASLLNLELQF